MKHALVVAALLAAQVPFASAQPVSPAFDATGVWQSDGGGSLQMFQRDAKLTMVFVGPDYAHRLDASYASATSASGVQLRVTRATGCSTRMKLTLDVVSPDTILAHAVALDSNCDLVRGQVIDNVLSRLL